MTTVAVIDVNQKIVQLTEEMSSVIAQGGAATPYFEELWYSLTVCLEELQAITADHEARLVAGGL